MLLTPAWLRHIRYVDCETWEEGREHSVPSRRPRDPALEEEAKEKSVARERAAPLLLDFVKRSEHCSTTYVPRAEVREQEALGLERVRASLELRRLRGEVACLLLSRLRF